MPAATYTPLANITLGSAVASVSFSSISQIYRDLVLVVTGNNSTASEQDFKLQFNSDTANNYSDVNAAGYTGGLFSQTDSRSYVSIMYAPNNSSPFGNSIVNIMDFSSTDKHKIILSRWNTKGSTTDLVVMSTTRWANTSAITSMVITAASGNINMGSTLALYGIASA